MNNIDNILSQLGLDEKEKEVYITCLKYKQINASSLARLIKLPRTTVYGIIDRLIKRSLLKSQQTTKGTSFTAVWAKEILLILESKRKELEINIKLVEDHQEEFDMMWITKFKNLPAINYYEGLDAVNMVYNQYSKAKEVFALFDVESALNHSNYTVKQLSQIPKKSKWTTKEILIKSSAAEEYKSYLKSKINQVKLLTSDSEKKIFMWVQIL